MTRQPSPEMGGTPSEQAANVTTAKAAFRREMRRLQNLYNRGRITRSQCYGEGVQAANAAYRDALGISGRASFLSPREG